MIGRRTFLNLLGGAAAARAAGALVRLPGLTDSGLGEIVTADPVAAAGPESGVLRGPEALARLDPVGVQLYTLRGEMREDFDGTLATVASIGYREVEFAGYFDRTPAQVRAALDANGLTSPATHIGMDQISAAPEATWEAAATIGHRYVVVPSLGRGQRGSADAFREVAASLNQLGESAARTGLRIGYHNHNYEFSPVDGVRPFDILLQETDPDLVVFEMDIYWIRVGGGDWRAYFERWPGRFHMIHAKDLAAGPDGGMTEVGSGVIDFPAILAASEQAGIRHTFVEHDSPTDAVASVRASFQYLSGLGG